MLHEWSHPINNYVGDGLIGSVAKANKSKLYKTFWFINLGNQTNKSIIQVLRERIP